MKHANFTRSSANFWGTAILYVCFFASPSYSSLTSELNELFTKQTPPQSEWSVLFESLDNGKSIYSLSPRNRLIPASNMKIAVCAAILLRLGPDFVYETGLYSYGKASGSTLNGDLIVEGSGDPSIGGRFHDGDVTFPLRQWAAALKIIDIKTVSGNIIGVDDVFDDEAHGLNWDPSYFSHWYAAEISGLSFNDACIDFTVTGAKTAKAKPSVSLSPDTNYITFENNAQTVSSQKQASGISIVHESDSTVFRLNGSIRAKSVNTHPASIPNPTLFFATVFKETLQNEGIQVKGDAQDGDAVKSLPNRSQWNLIDVIKSPPLIDLISVCLKNSQNLYAEHFLKTLGSHDYGEGSVKMGALALKDVFFKNGCDLDGQFIADGCGLSRENRISAESIVRVMRCMEASPYGKIFREALSVAGEDGTLKRRMANSAADGRVWGKTGTINGVRALSGCIQAKSGKTYLFSMLANGRRSAVQFTQIMDDACVLVCEKG
ncbi:MAG: D-alanyl-D-alanine carboxypeptidase/D-alanyl-D-alanine-endopeptidase [Candidatus Omnitrophota bacterium]